MANDTDTDFDWSDMWRANDDSTIKLLHHIIIFMVAVVLGMWLAVAWLGRAEYHSPPPLDSFIVTEDK